MANYLDYEGFQYFLDKFKGTALADYIKTADLGDCLKTVNGQSLVGSGDITISSGDMDLSAYLTKEKSMDLSKQIARQTYLSCTKGARTIRLTIPYFDGWYDSGDCDVSEYIQTVSFDDFPVASDTYSGLMSAEDYVKLDELYSAYSNGSLGGGDGYNDSALKSGVLSLLSQTVGGMTLELDSSGMLTFGLVCPTDWNGAVATKSLEVDLSGAFSVDLSSYAQRDRVVYLATQLAKEFHLDYTASTRTLTSRAYYPDDWFTIGDFDITLVTSNTVLPLATVSADGLMSSEQYTMLQSLYSAYGSSDDALVALREKYPSSVLVGNVPNWIKADGNFSWKGAKVISYDADTSSAVVRFVMTDVEQQLYIIRDTGGNTIGNISSANSEPYDAFIDLHISVDNGTLKPYAYKLRMDI